MSKRPLAGLIIATLCALVSAAPSLAARPSTTTQQFVNAQAQSEDCFVEAGRTVCEYSRIEIKNIDGLTEDVEVCLYVVRTVYRRNGAQTSSGETGCTTIPYSSLEFDTKNLTEVILPETTITLVGDNGTERAVTVTATFTGTGDIVRTTDEGTVSEGGCRRSYEYESAQRSAEGTYTFDGETVTVSDASLFTASLQEIRRCRA